MNQYFTQNFWIDFLHKAGEWVLTVVPSIVLLIVVLIISLKIVKMLIHKMHRIVVQRAGKHDPDNIAETEKRINTLMGILHGLGKIILWSVFLMILLKKLGIDIGPILAGAGILGLAVGFGAQELVRDFISGFFILLENQIRAGDVAIINGTGGLVE
ncbi:MAG TPA: mechanosensitive ion channel domain-containing protein, partial [Bacteroidales bacterium]|nr:mechanosensitive ion channel domain-containing protein [Bacteroidales bacterium]